MANSSYRPELDQHRATKHWIDRSLLAKRELASLTDGTVAAIILGGFGALAFGGLLYLVSPRETAPLLIGGALISIWSGLSYEFYSWWRGYRNSPRQLIHQLLSREGVIAQADELEAHFGEDKTIAAAATLRTAFTRRVRRSRANALAPILHRAEMRESVAVSAETIGDLHDESHEAAIATRVLDGFERIAVPSHRLGEPPDDIAEPPVQAAVETQIDDDEHLLAHEYHLLARPRPEPTNLTPIACRVPLQIDGQGVKPEDVAWQLGTSNGEPIWIPVESPMMVVGPARSGKGVHLVVNAIHESPGAVITTSTRADNMEMTALCRTKRGQVYLFDLDEATGRPHTIRWSPLEGCKDPKTASRRGDVLVRSSGLGGENQVWATVAASIFTAMLHAAALEDLGVQALYKWSRSPKNAQEPLRILLRRSQATVDPHRDRWHETLEALEGEDSRLLGSKWFGVDNAMAGLAEYKVREKLDHTPGTPGYFDTDAFLDSASTIYMVADGADSSAATAGTVGGIYSLFLDHVTDRAHRRAIASGRRRLDPPLTLVLDELANIHPWQGAARMMAAGSGESIQLMAFFQTADQAVAAYDKEMANILKDNSVNVILGNSKDTEFLETICRLVGKRTINEKSTRHDGGSLKFDTTTSKREVDGITADELRRLPFGTAAVLAGSARLAIVTMTPFYKGAHQHCIADSERWHQANPDRVLISHVQPRREVPS